MKVKLNEAKLRKIIREILNKYPVETFDGEDCFSPEGEEQTVGKIYYLGLSQEITPEQVLILSQMNYKTTGQGLTLYKNINDVKKNKAIYEVIVGNYQDEDENGVIYTNPEDIQHIRKIK